MITEEITQSDIDGDGEPNGVDPDAVGDGTIFVLQKMIRPGASNKNAGSRSRKSALRGAFLWPAAKVQKTPFDLKSRYRL